MYLVCIQHLLFCGHWPLMWLVYDTAPPDHASGQIDALHTGWRTPSITHLSCPGKPRTYSFSYPGSTNILWRPPTPAGTSESTSLRVSKQVDDTKMAARGWTSNKGIQSDLVYPNSMKPIKMCSNCWTCGLLNHCKQKTIEEVTRKYVRIVGHTD